MKTALLTSSELIPRVWAETHWCPERLPLPQPELACTVISGGPESRAGGGWGAGRQSGYSLSPKGGKKTFLIMDVKELF